MLNCVFDTLVIVMLISQIAHNHCRFFMTEGNSKLPRYHILDHRKFIANKVIFKNATHQAS